MMASFQVKIGWKRTRKSKNKNCLFVPFLPDGQLKIQKQKQKNWKIKIYHYGLIPSQNRLEKFEKERK